MNHKVQRQAEGFVRVCNHLGIEPDEDTDPVTVICMVQNWEADAQARVDLLQYHLRQVLEIARTWMPDYATAMDINTLSNAQGALRDK